MTMAASPAALWSGRRCSGCSPTCRDGKVDVVVVYKVDRLTRSLADFAKIVEIFDAKGVSFVSVTQQFNTTTSMGRLTLNVLLSFAQFEREVTGERIRDKIAASKKKGMWMGGRRRSATRPASENSSSSQRRPRPCATSSAAIWRSARCGCCRRSSKRRTSRTSAGPALRGGIWGSKPFARGALYTMLRNRIYRGEIVYQDQTYPGVHQAIIDSALWDAVQARLAENAVERGTGIRSRTRACSPSYCSTARASA